MENIIKRASVNDNKIEVAVDENTFALCMTLKDLIKQLEKNRMAMVQK